MSFPSDKFPPPAPLEPEQKGLFHQLTGVPLKMIHQPGVAWAQEQAREKERQELNVQVPAHLSTLSQAVRQSQDELTAARIQHAKTAEELQAAQLRHQLAEEAIKKADYNGPLSMEPRVPDAESSALKVAGVIPGIKYIAMAYTWGKYGKERIPATLEERDAARSLEEARRADGASRQQALHAQSRHDIQLEDVEAKAKAIYAMYNAHQKRE